MIQNQFLIHTHKLWILSSTDRTPRSDCGNAGSIPAESANIV